MPDVPKLIGLVLEQDGIRVEKGAVIFALATVCQAYLDETSNQVDQRVGKRLADFEASVQKVQTRAGQLVGTEFNERVATLRNQLEGDITAAGVKASEMVSRIELANRLPFVLRWLAIGFLSALALFAAGILMVPGFCIR